MSSDSGNCCVTCKKTPAQLQLSSLKKCAKCLTATYCSRQCQADDWKLHKRSCGGGKGKDTSTNASSSSSSYSSAKPALPKIPISDVANPRNREEREAIERIIEMVAASTSPSESRRLDAIEQAGWGYYPDPRLPPGMPSRRDFMESHNSDNIDYDFSTRSATITAICRLTQGNNIGARKRAAAANATFEREYATSRKYLVGNSHSPFSGSKAAAIRAITEPRKLLAALQEKFACYEFLIDAYRLRLTDEYGLSIPRILRNYNPIKHFGEFVDKSHNKGILPGWWIEGGEVLNMVCIRFAMKKDGGACILQLLGPIDMREKYAYEGVVTLLRRLAAEVYGNALATCGGYERLKNRGVWLFEDAGEWHLNMNNFWKTLS
ncbi:hypothetical protein BDZ91DRAFT_744599 [Kalaharituber pfeilii]|nr:hypothetical protein BDZ91DRAFT_744599 [Kalaharituber pfeilii]